MKPCSIFYYEESFTWRIIFKRQLFPTVTIVGTWQDFFLFKYKYILIYIITDIIPIHFYILWFHFPLLLFFCVFSMGFGVIVRVSKRSMFANILILLISIFYISINFIFLFIYLYLLADLKYLSLLHFVCVHDLYFLCVHMCSDMCVGIIYIVSLLLCHMPFL